MIIVKNRELLVPLPERYIGTSYDTSSEIRQFRVPRFAQNGTDLSPLTFYVDLLHADGSNSYDTITMGEVGDANYKVVDDNYIILTWYITRNVLQNPGALFVQLRAMDSENTVRWGSFKAVFYVERHLNAPGNYGGSLTLIEQIQQDHNYFKSVIDEVAALPQYVDTAEAWAVGRRNGHDVASSDITYHNNAKYFAENASDFAGNASQYMRKSQAYAEGKVGDQDVDSSNPAYHNNAKYYALEAEAWGVGKRNGENVHSNDPAYHNNALYYKGKAEYFMNKAETEKNFARMWADGTDYEGSPITEEWPQYHNNAKYYSEQADASSNLAGVHKDAAQLAAQQAANSATAAAGSATAASGSAGQASAAMLAAQNASNDARAAADTAAQGSADSSGYAQDSEAWAVGQRDGVDVDSSDPTYHNNSKYYKDQSTTWAGFASGSMLNSEAWAVGQKNGTDVPATAEQYHNNSKYYSEQAAAAATRAESAAESLTVDDALSDTSTNAVQNKVVTAVFTDVLSQIDEKVNVGLTGIRTLVDRKSEVIEGYYLPSGYVGDTLDINGQTAHSTAQQESGYCVFSVAKGDAVIYIGSQFGSFLYRNITFTDNNYKITSVNDSASVGSRTLVRYAPSDGYCSVNAVLKQSASNKYYAIYHIQNDTYNNTKDAVETLVSKSQDYDELLEKEYIKEILDLVANEYVDSNGAFKSYNNWSRTDYIECAGRGSIVVVNNTSTTMQYNCFFNSNHELVGSKFTLYGGQNTKTVPASAAYVVFSAQTSVMQKLDVYLGDYDVVLHDELPLTSTMRDEIEEMIDDGAGTSQCNAVAHPNAYIMRTLIPNYYFNRNETPESYHDIGYIEDKISSVPDGYHFIFVTDTHWNDNAMQSTKLISYVRDRIGAKHVLFGGDILTAHNTKEKAFRWLYDFVSEFKNAFGSDLLLTVGNHDLNHAGSQSSDAWITYNELIPVFLQGNSNAFHYCDYSDRIDSLIDALSIDPDDVQGLKDYFKTIYYVDDDYGKTRYLIYNTGGGSTAINQYTGVDGSNEDLLILDWAYDVLMSTPEGYNFVACSHIPTGLDWDVDTPGSRPIASSRQSFPSLIAAVKSKRSLTVSYPDIGSLSVWTGTSSQTFDFANAPDLGVVMIIGGHYHIDSAVIGGFSSTSSLDRSHFYGTQAAFNATAYECYQSATAAENGHRAYELPIIYTQHDAYIHNDVEHSYPKTYGTITEQSFDVVTITPGGNIALTRFGAGYDRTVTIH